MVNIENINQRDSEERKHGVWIELYDNNKQLKSITTYVHGVEHGVYKKWSYAIWTPNGNLQGVINFAKGLGEGEGIYFNY